jgi:arsenite methyltransferase
MNQVRESNSARVTAESSVQERYAAAAHVVEPALCCPVSYNPDLLAAIPTEVIEKDYGCGDPTPFVKVGDSVLDLGSGAGKLCFIAAQVVGPTGQVVGVDCNRSMLDLARRNAPTVAQRIGFANVQFRYGMIQDLKLDFDRLQANLATRPIGTIDDFLVVRQEMEVLRQEHPLIESESMDCVLSNCVLNLVRPEDRRELFAEVFRVLRPGGRAAISDIVCDEDVPQHMQCDSNLWSGCVSGAFREDHFVQAFHDAGFYGIEIVKRADQPWQTIQGIEFRSMTVVAYKRHSGPCLERQQAVIYRGPFKQVEDDDGHVYWRGKRMAVCDKTFQFLAQAPYAGMFEPVLPRQLVPIESAPVFDCHRSTFRDPRETKGHGFSETDQSSGTDCGTGGLCC